MIQLTLIILVFTNLPNLTCEARSSVGISEDSNRNSVENLDREMVAAKPRFEGGELLQKRGAQERRKRKKKKKKQVSCVKKPLQAKCFKGMAKKQKILETKMKKHLGRKRFDLFEKQIADQIKNVSSEMIKMKNSSMNMASLEALQANFSQVWARMKNYTRDFNATRYEIQK